MDTIFTEQEQQEIIDDCDPCPTCGELMLRGECHPCTTGEGPTGCMDDNDDLSRALRGMTHQELNHILDEQLNR